MSAEHDEFEISPAEARAGGVRHSRIGIEDVRLAAQRVRATGVLDKIAEWRQHDRHSRAAGGRKPIISDHHVLVALLLLAREHSPLWITSIRDLLWFRLTDEARTYLNVPSTMGDPSDEFAEGKRWLNNAWNAFHRIVDTMDPYPVPNRRALMDRETRENLIAARDPERQREMRERLDLYTSMWLEMTFQMQPKHIRDRQKIMDVAVDQTPIWAASKKGRSKTDEAGREVKDKKILEPDAHWYPTKSKDRFKDDGTPETDWVWGFAANISVRVMNDAYEAANIPLIAMAYSLSRPGTNLAADTVRIHRMLRDRGHTPGRCTADRGYFALLKFETLGLPMKILGFSQLTEYLTKNLGNKGGKAGAVYNEGLILCPGVPKNLARASIDAMNHTIDEDTYRKRIDERLHFQLKDKERPDHNGSVPKVCPALGPSATVECEHRELHANAPRNKDRPHTVLGADFALDKICTKTSVSFKHTDNADKAQAIPFGTENHSDTYRRDRSTNEGFNAYVKDPGYEDLDASSRRRARGLTAQQMLSTMGIVSANIRKIMTFMHDEAKRLKAHTPRPKLGPKATPARGRDKGGKNPYRKKWPLKHLPDKALKQLPGEASEVDPPLRT